MSGPTVDYAKYGDVSCLAAENMKTEASFALWLAGYCGH